MRTNRVAMTMALWLVACGGSARSGDQGASGSVGGVAGTGGDNTNNVGGQSNGTAGEPSVGAAGGPAGDDAGSAGSAGSAGEASQCVGLDCLAGAHLLYQPSRTWHAPTGPFNSSSELSETDYTPMVGVPIAVTVSDDATAIQLEPTAGGATVPGGLNPAYSDRAWYELELFAGGRFVVQLVAGEFVAEYTVYGSGSPIVSSTRGTLKNAR